MNITMTEYPKRISNPLTIVAIFAGLAEVSGTVALSIVSVELQPQFIWFVMLFPIFLVTIFFLTLNFNPEVLYSPGDFSDEANFMSLQRAKAATDLTNIEKLLSADEKELTHEFNRLRTMAERNGANPVMPERVMARMARGAIAQQMGAYMTEAEFAKRMSASKTPGDDA